MRCDGHDGNDSVRHDEHRSTPTRWKSWMVTVDTAVSTGSLPLLSVASPSPSASVSIRWECASTPLRHIPRSTLCNAAETSVKNSSVGPSPVPTSPRYSTSSMDLCAPYSSRTRTALSNKRHRDTRTFCRWIRPIRTSVGRSAPASAMRACIVWRARDTPRQVEAKKIRRPSRGKRNLQLRASGLHHNGSAPEHSAKGSCN
mmetsp:Transcript_42587/g.100215  ORF Transcript_42587/g.100215 Transcript_42587/m.100215 type:complete len:201 (-) Transcript_42587:185-787(-)